MLRTCALILGLLIGCSGDAGPSSDAPAKSAKAAESAKPAKAAKGGGKAAKGGGKAAKVTRSPEGKKAEAAPAAPTASNWKSHPTIVSIRDEVTAINGSINEGRVYEFPDFCGDEGIMKVELFATEHQGAYRKYNLREAGLGDISRETTAYYDASDAGKVIFAVSVYSHGSAGSSVIRRQYYVDGKLFFEAPTEVKESGLGAPSDDTPMAELVPMTHADAFRKQSSIAGKCGG